LAKPFEMSLAAVSKRVQMLERMRIHPRASRQLLVFEPQQQANGHSRAVDRALPCNLRRAPENLAQPFEMKE
jgi:hypothetical protein